MLIKHPESIWHLTGERFRSTLLEDPGDSYFKGNYLNRIRHNSIQLSQQLDRDEKLRQCGYASTYSDNLLSPYA